MTSGVRVSVDSENGIKIGEVSKTRREHKGASKVDFVDEYIVLDLETTGLDPSFDEIIEIAAIKFTYGEKTSVFNTLVKPYKKIDGYITNLTGITNEMVKDAPRIEMVLPDLIKFVGDSVVVAHNANFDINFLYDNYLHYFEQTFTNDFIDTMRISRRLFKDIRHRLIDLANEFQIRIDSQHRALADCEITQNVYEYMKRHCYKNGIDVASLVKTPCSKGFYITDFKVEVDRFDESHPLYGRSVCFTGVLEKFQRKEALQIVTNLGGIPADAVTKNLNILVLGNNDYCSTIKDGKSNKHKKAEQLILKGHDLIIISEKVFYDII